MLKFVVGFVLFAVTRKISSLRTVLPPDETSTDDRLDRWQAKVRLCVL
jgi:hypothetical protein